MTEKRQSAAVQQGPGTTRWQLVNSAEQRRSPDGSGALLSTPMYWFYEMGHAALNPARAFADATRLFFKNPANPLVAYRLRQVGRRGDGTVRALDAPLRPAGMGHRLDHWSAASACRCTSRRVWERPFCRLLHFERAFEHAPRRPQPKLLIVAPMSGHYADAAARHGRGLPAQSRRLHHRLGRCAHGAARGGPLRSRRLHRLRHLDAARARRRHACDRACASRRCRCWRRSRSWRRTDDPYVPLSMTLMGGPIDTRVNPTAVNKLAEAARHRLVPPPRHHQGAVPASRLHARRLSGLPAAQRLHEHEPRSPHRGAPQPVPPPGQGRRRFGAEAPRVLRRISRGHGSRGRVLSADGRDRVHPPRAAEGRDDPSRQARSIRRRSAASR